MPSKRTRIVPPGTARSGFTLMELLVTIGIIVLLISLLIPTVSRVRRAAQAAATQQLISSMAAAIDNYVAEQREYPGPFTDAPVDRLASPSAEWAMVNGIQINSASLGPLRPSRSEELLMCLTGGMGVTFTNVPPFAVTGFTYDPQSIGRGHTNLGPKNRQRLKDFMATRSSRTDSAAAGPHFVSDTAIPEFVDNFERPILYVRGVKGGGALAYMLALRAETDRYLAGQTYPDTYLNSETLGDQIRQGDRYILVSAGVDGKYGTADDITNFGQPKMQ